MARKNQDFGNRVDVYLWFLGRRNTVQHCQPPVRKTNSSSQWQTYDDRHPSSVQHRKDDVSPPADVANRRGSDIHDDEVADPVGGGTDGTSLLASLER